MLLWQWPPGECLKRQRAMEACLKVIRGEKPPSSAQRAFVAAAKQARIFLRELN